MIMITLSTFLSVIVINLYFRGDKRNRVPRWLKIVSVSACYSSLRFAAYRLPPLQNAKASIPRLVPTQAHGEDEPTKVATAGS